MTCLDEVARVTRRPAMGVAPSIARRRPPPRPQKLRRRDRGRRAAALVGGIAGVACIPLLWLAVASEGGGRLLMREAPWQSLPAVPTPAREKRELRLTPDAWTIASAVWNQPVPTPSAVAPRPPAVEIVDSRPGYLTVVVEPWARVALDGGVVGETPLGKLELPPGTHRLTLANDHVVGLIHDDVVIAPGASVLRRYSFNDVGYLQVVASPWADVSVDGRTIGQTPLARVAVPTGPHTVRFSHPRLGDAERSVHVSSGQTTVVKVEFQGRAP